MKNYMNKQYWAYRTKKDWKPRKKFTCITNYLCVRAM